MEALKIGDVVMLNSGGPKMTIVDIFESDPQQNPQPQNAGSVICKWWSVQRAEYKSQEFFRDTITKNGLLPSDVDNI